MIVRGPGTLDGVKESGLCRSQPESGAYQKRGDKKMKTLKVGIILLVFLLAAMVTVPMVNAKEINYSLVSDVSTLSVPQLHFNNSQNYATVKTELDPALTTRPSDITNLLATSQNPDVSKIPYGSIVYHSKSGVTTVFDSNGNQLFAARDANSPEIPTPAGSMPATHVFGFPSGSVILTWGNTTYVSYHNVLLFREIDEGASTNSKTFSPTPGLSDPNSYVEGIYGTPTSSSLSNYVTYWTVPSNPQYSNDTPVTGGIVHYPVFLWNGIQTIGNSPILGMPELIQPVLQWNTKTSPDEWSLASWVIFGSISSGHSTEVTGVSAGDVILGQMSYSPGTATWTVLARDTSVSGMPTATYSVVNSMPNSIVNTEVYLESWAGNNVTYMPGATPFYTFIVTDTSGNNCSPSSITLDYQRAIFSNLILNIANSAYWPNTISHPLIFTTH